MEHAKLKTPEGTSIVGTLLRVGDRLVWELRLQTPGGKRISVSGQPGDRLSHVADLAENSYRVAILKDDIDARRAEKVGA